jgi:hypothetical protein
MYRLKSLIRCKATRIVAAFRENETDGCLWATSWGGHHDFSDRIFTPLMADMVLVVCDVSW